MYTHTSYTPWIQHFVKVTRYTIGEKHTQYIIPKYYNYFTYNIKMFHQIHYIQLTAKIMGHF